MKKIYCISSGSYSDWGISYAFESEEKRDGMLKMLDDDYNSYDIELDDDRIDIDKIKTVYTCSVYNDDDYFVEKHTVINDNTSKNEVYVNNMLGLYNYVFEISKEQYENPDKYKSIFSKIFKDKEAEIRYMLDVEGMCCEEIMETLNK